MRTIATRALAAVAVCGVAVLGAGAPGVARDAQRSGEPDTVASVLTIPASARLPLTKQIAVGAGKSLMVQFPVPLKDVLVADPSRLDAVVQSATQVFLIARGTGATNAFFFDENGQQVLTLEVTIGADLGGLESLLRRLIPGSNIKLETAGKSIVLTGTVRTPVDSNRAADIALEFAKASKGATASAPTAGGAGDATAATVTATSRGATAPAAGFEADTAAQKPVINLLQVEGEEQVQLRVHVAEVSRSLLKQLGVNLSAEIAAGGFATTLLSANALPLTAAAGLGSLAVPGIVPGDPQATPPTQSYLSYFNKGPSNAYGASGPTSSLDLGNGNRLRKALQMLERDGLIRTLAEPNLTAVSGEAAKFLAGGEFPIPVIDGQGGISVIFKEFGVGVAFTPVVMSEGRISLKIEAEVSELSTEGAVTIGGFSIPALKKRQAKSTLELPSGGSIAMAGLISDKVRQNIDGYPGLKDLPVLGTLFRSRDFIKEETELVVIVTPHVVRATSRQKLVSPIDGLAEASDLRANLLGHLNRVYARPDGRPMSDLKGDYGFIVE
jgi:pilus assembly protein CpaC